jgi:hypothetical protein
MNFSIDLVDVFTIVCKFAPGFTKPWTSKPCSSLCCSSCAHPLAWQSPMIIILFCFLSEVFLLHLPFLLISCTAFALSVILPPIYSTWLSSSDCDK